MDVSWRLLQPLGLPPHGLSLGPPEAALIHDCQEGDLLEAELRPLAEKAAEAVRILDYCDEPGASSIFPYE